MLSLAVLEDLCYVMFGGVGGSIEGGNNETYDVKAKKKKYQ